MSMDGPQAGVKIWGHCSPDGFTLTLTVITLTVTLTVTLITKPSPPLTGLDAGNAKGRADWAAVAVEVRPHITARR